MKNNFSKQILRINRRNLMIAATLVFVLGSINDLPGSPKEISSSGIFLLNSETMKHPERWKIPVPQILKDDKPIFSLYHPSGAKVWEKELALSPDQRILTGEDIFGDRIPPALGYYFYRITDAPADELPHKQTLISWFQDVSNTHLPGDSTVAGFSEFIDANGDAFPDIIIGLNSFTAPLKPQILINDGSGHYTNESESRFPSIEMFVNDVAVFDADGDADLDIYFATTTNQFPPTFQDKLFLNEGNGIFNDVSATHLPMLPTISQNVDWGFINNDSFPDLVIAGFPDGIPPNQTKLFILLNDGSGHFTDQSAVLPFTQYGVMDAALADVNSDSLMDIVLADLEFIITGESGNPIDTLSGQNAVFIQQPNNTFVDETISRMPAIERWSKLMKIADINNDNAPDLYSINIGFDAPFFTNVLYMNNGNGIFQDETASRFPPETIAWNNDVEFQDFDGDGDQDFFMINVVVGGTAPDYLYRNDNALFSDISNQLPPIVDFNASCTSSDMDGDTDLDIFISADSGVLNSTGLPDVLYENLLITSGMGNQRLNRVFSFQLNQNYPNPFNPTTTISYQLPASGEVELTIYNLLGQRIRGLVNTKQPAGTHQVEWDGRDDAGRKVASSVYIYRIETEGIVQSRKMVLIH